MDLQVTQENLNKALNHVARVASGRSTLPILSNILLKTVNNRLSIAATNLDIAITQFIGSKITKEGSITVPARLFQDFINNLPNGTIHLKQEEHKLHIQSGSYSSVINGVLADEFPVMPTIKKGGKIKLEINKLKKALQQVVFAASSDEARPVLTGVFIHTQENQLYIAATDSYRLAEKKLTPHKDSVSLLVPSTATLDLLRILSDSNEDVEITHDEQQVLFRVGDIELIARLIEGNYPDYKKLIPTKFSYSATVNKTELITITKISGLFSRENAGSVKVSVDEQTKELTVNSIASQAGENTGSTKGEIKGSGEITLNSRYLLEGLQAIDGDEVSFCFNEKLEPIILKQPAKTDYTHVIMPLKS